MKKYKVFVSLGGEMQGEYDGIEYSREEAEAIKKSLANDENIENVWIEEV